MREHSNSNYLDSFRSSNTTSNVTVSSKKVSSAFTTYLNFIGKHESSNFGALLDEAQEQN
jgi:hypothetical protein